MKLTTLNYARLIYLYIQVVNIVPVNQQRFKNSTLQLGLFGCNFEKFCSVTIYPPLENSYTTPCCAPCSCLPNCWLIGDCCPDVQEVNYESPFGNVELKCRGNSFNLRPKYFYEPLESYKMITQCPFDYTDNKTKQLCEEPFGAEFSIHNFSFSDILPVSSLDHFVFRNAHCAACHEIRNFQRWDLIFASCSSLIDDDKELEYVIKECSAYTFPPEGIGAERSRCFGQHHIITTCSDLGNLDQVDEDVATACRFSLFPLIYGEGKLQRFFNIYCLLCNEPNIKLPLECDEDDINLKDALNPKPYLTFISFDLTTTKVTTSPMVYRCQKNQIYDDLMNVCRDLSCPFSRKPEYGACVSSNYRRYNTGIIFPISFTTLDVDINSILGLYHLDTIGNTFLESVELLTLCNICYDYLFYRGSDNQSVIIDLPIYLTNKCTYADIEKALSPVKSLYIRSKVVFRRKRFGVNATFKMFPIFNNSKGESFYYGKVCRTADVFKMHRLFDCAYIILNETEYCMWLYTDMYHQNKTCSLTNHSMQSDKTMEMFYINGDINIRICLSAYLKTDLKSVGTKVFVFYEHTIAGISIALVFWLNC